MSSRSLDESGFSKPAKSKRSKSSKDARRPKSVHHSKVKHKLKKPKKDEGVSPKREKFDGRGESSTFKREEWMIVPLLRPSDSPVETVAPARSKEVSSYKPGEHHRELNPYWKNGGSGFPRTSVSGGSSNVEGRSWILRSYKQALERAEKEKKSFDEIAQQQWGSIDKLHSLLRSVGIDPFLPDISYLSAQSPSNVVGKSLLPVEVTQSSNFSSPIDKKTERNCHGISGSCSSQTVDSRPLPKVNMVELESTSPAGVCVTEAMINSTSAKLIKAELVGNKEKVEHLKKEINDLRSRKKVQDSQKCQQEKTSEKTVILTKTDRFGRVQPAVLPNSQKSKGKSKYVDEYSLSALVEMEHRTTSDDTYEAIAKMASKFVRSRDDVVDDVLDIKTKSKDDQKNRSKILTESRQMQEIVSSCKLCLTSPCFNKNVLVALGMNTYLSVPHYESLCDGHCLIIPSEHVACSMNMDENVWSEVKIFQRGLSKMFADNNMDVIFTECYTSTSRRSHMYIECIPIPKEEGSMAPMYFKKAILESDAEWTNNRKLIDTRMKGFKKSIPNGLPYFFVDFNNEGGFAHIIEEAPLFPHYFAKEVIGGLIDVEPRLWLKPHYETFEQQKAKAFKVKDMWKPYDWTEQLCHQHFP